MEVSREREVPIIMTGAGAVPSATAIKMIAADSFYNDTTIPQHVKGGEPYHVESAALADAHEKRGIGHRAAAEGAKAEAPPANKAEAKPANKAEGKPANKAAAQQRKRK